jgi:hypothetical protein
VGGGQAVGVGQAPRSRGLGGEQRQEQRVHGGQSRGFPGPGGFPGGSSGAFRRPGGASLAGKEWGPRVGKGGGRGPRWHNESALHPLGVQGAPSICPGSAGQVDSSYP